MKLPYDPVIPLLDLHPKKRKSIHRRDFYGPTFLETPFVIIKIECHIYECHIYIYACVYIYVYHSFVNESLLLIQLF